MELFLQDRHTKDASSPGRPSLDDENHLTLIEGEEVDGVTRIMFRRTKTLDCNDTSGHDLAVTQGTSRVIYAFHEDDGDESDADSISYHLGNRGSQSVNLWYGSGDEVELESDVVYHDLLMTNWSVASDETEYVCKLFELPKFDDKQHIVMIEPPIQSENEGTVHHFLLYVCPNSSINGTVSDIHQETCDEWDTNMPHPDCRDARLQAAWAIGGENFYMPEEAGLPFAGDSDFYYAFLEVHYDNPEYRDDIVDSSGMRLWYTPTLRTYDVGTLWIGIEVNPFFQFTPPGLVSTLTGYCARDCTEQGIPEEGVTAFASVLHAHYVGSALYLRHVRNGTELEPLDWNDDYDFNYQTQVTFETPRTFLPGDHFIMQCEYDTTSRDVMTFAGLGSSQEMCLTFIWVYPIPDMAQCENRISYESMTDWLDDSYYAGFWEAHNQYDLTVQDAVDDNTTFPDINRPADVHPLLYWEGFNISWKSDMEGAKEMFDMLYNNQSYEGREQICYNSGGVEIQEGEPSTFDEEFGNFEEYCMDQCVCGTDSSEDEDAVEETDDDDNTLVIVGIVIGVVLVVIIFASVIFMMIKNRKVTGSVKAQHVSHTSTASGG